MLALVRNAYSFLVCLPTLRSVPLSLRADYLRTGTIILSVNTPANDDDVATRTYNHLPRRSILLSHAVSFGVESNSWSQNQEIFVQW